MRNWQGPGRLSTLSGPYLRSLWAVADEAGASITLHILTGRLLVPLALIDTQTPEERGENPRGMLDLSGEIQGVLANDFIFGGILDRFPRLKVVCSEFELSSIPHFMWNPDWLQDLYGFGPRMHLHPLKMKASDYIRTRVYHGLMMRTVRR